MHVCVVSGADTVSYGWWPMAPTPFIGSYFPHWCSMAVLSCIKFLKVYDMVSGLHLVPLIYLSVPSSLPIILISIDFYVLIPNKKSWTSFTFMEWIHFGHNVLPFFYVSSINMLILYLVFLHICSLVEWFCDYFFSNRYVWFWYQGYIGLIECLKKCSLFSYSIEEVKWYWNYLFL